VKLVAADRKNPPVFSVLSFRAGRNLTLDGLALDYVFDGPDKAIGRPMILETVSDFKLLNMKFDGDIAYGFNNSADGKAFANGVTIRNSTNVVVASSQFTKWYRAITILDSSKVQVSKNTITDGRSDGVVMAAVSDIVIEGNSFSNFTPARGPIPPAGGRDHPDMIQMWSRGAKTVSFNIKILNNNFDMGKGQWTQTIFMRNELADSGLKSPDMFYRNIEISGNRIRNSHLHGITVGETKSLTIQNNQIMQGPITEDAAVWMPRINVAANSTEVQVSGNLTPTDTQTRLIRTNPAWRVVDNLIWRPAAEKQAVNQNAAAALEGPSKSTSDLSIDDGITTMTNPDAAGQ
jgi:Right handed beta helix region